MTYRMLRLLALFFGLASIVALSFVVHAEEKKGPLLAVWIEGADLDFMREAVISAVPDGLDVDDPQNLVDAMAKEGQVGPIAHALDTPGLDEKLFARAKTARKTLGVDAVLLVRSRNVAGKTKARIVVIEDDVALDVEVTLPKKGSDDDPAPAKAIADVLTPKLKSLLPPPPPPVASSSSPPIASSALPPPAPSYVRPPHDPSRSIVDVHAGLEIGLRGFHYTDRLTTGLRDYDLSAAPLVTFGGEVFPFASMAGPIGDVGLVASYARALGIRSAPDGGEKIATTWDRFLLAVKMRFRVGDDERHPIVIGGSLGYGGESFTFDGASPIAAQAPGVEYRFVRIGADVRARLGPIAIFGALAYLPVTSGGDVKDRFPHASLGGLDLSLGAALPLPMITNGFEARALVRYARFFYSMNPEPGDAYVAGGALDQLVGFGLEAGYVF